jgi:GT2 family glycosyltransferase
VRRATGEILLFLDSDVVPHADCLQRVAAFFASPPVGFAAVIGSYDWQPLAPGVVSQFRNLLHCYVHCQSAGEVASFWGGCSAVRRAAFFEAGGFDEAFRLPSIEDVEFGWRLQRAGHKILLDPNICLTHRKRWTLRSMVSTDLRRRAIPWTMLAWSGVALPRNLNFTLPRRFSVVAAALMSCGAALALVDVRFLWLAVAAFAAMAALNLPYLRWTHAHRGPAFTACCLPLLALHYLTQAAGWPIGTAAALAVLGWRRSMPHRPLPEALRQLSG